MNGELRALESVLPEAIAALALHGRIVVLAYHSLEDRLVKQILTAASRDRAPRDLPVVPAELRPQLRLLTRGAMRPSAAEIARNPRAASARLRAAERDRRAAGGRMSALWAPITGRREEIGTISSPLHAVAKPAARLARFPFLLVLIGIFGIGMAGLLMLNTTLQGQAFQSRTLNRQASELAYAQADLENQLDALAAPQELARRASALGMRPNPYPAFLVTAQRQGDRQAHASAGRRGARVHCQNARRSRG